MPKKVAYAPLQQAIFFQVQTNEGLTVENICAQLFGSKTDEFRRVREVFNRLRSQPAEDRLFLESDDGRVYINSMERRQSIRLMPAEKCGLEKKRVAETDLIRASTKSFNGKNHESDKNDKDKVSITSINTKPLLPIKQTCIDGCPLCGDMAFEKPDGETYFPGKIDTWTCAGCSQILHKQCTIPQLIPHEDKIYCSELCAKGFRLGEPEDYGDVQKYENVTAEKFRYSAISSFHLGLWYRNYNNTLVKDRFTAPSNIAIFVISGKASLVAMDRSSFQMLKISLKENDFVFIKSGTQYSLESDNLDYIYAGQDFEDLSGSDEHWLRVLQCQCKEMTDVCLSKTNIISEQKKHVANLEQQLGLYKKKFEFSEKVCKNTEDRLKETENELKRTEDKLKNAEEKLKNAINFVPIKSKDDLAYCLREMYTSWKQNNEVHARNTINNQASADTNALASIRI